MTPPPLLALALALGAAPDPQAPDTLARDTATAGRAPAPPVVPARAGAARPPADTGRPRAVAVSDAYATRLTIHRWGSYAMLPVFAAQYVLGSRLISQKEDVFAGRRTTPIDRGLRDAHVATAAGVGALFAVNTVTGVWNLYESRGVAEGRRRRTIHALLMLAADAGFVATGLAGRTAGDRGPDEARRHRTIALGSFGVATAGAAYMWLTRD